MWTIFHPSRKHVNLEWMQVDIHSHILPGIDDGCKTIVQSIDMLNGLENLGLQKFYFTPHVIHDLYPNNKVIIQNAYDKLLQKYSGSSFIGYAAEYMIDTNFDTLLAQHSEDFLCLPGKHILIEMSYVEESKIIDKVIFDLQMEGYTPILAHPERYIFYHRDPKKIKRLRDAGCLLQLNLLSVVGYYGQYERRTAKFLLDQGLINLIGTDVHHERHIHALEKALKREDIRPLFKHCHILNQELFGSPN